MDIRVDIDGTLTVETEGHDYRTRTPRKDIIEKINALHDEGHIIILWTSRYEIDRTVTENWLTLHCVCYQSIIMDKPKFDLYICDLVKNVEDL